MHDQPPGFEESVKAGHASGLNGKAIAIFFVLFVITLPTILTCLYFFLGSEIRRQARHEAAPFPLGALPPVAVDQPLQPSPTHPTLPWQDLPLLRNTARETLQTGGPIPGDPTHIRLPIDRAMQLFLARGGLHAATQPATRPADPSILPTRPATVENRT